MEKRNIFICDCHSLEHQFSFWYDEEVNQIYFEPHLYNSGPWYNRFWYRLKYVFGNKSRFGAWDEFIINPDDAKKIVEYLNNMVEKDVENIANRGRD